MFLFVFVFVVVVVDIAVMVVVCCGRIVIAVDVVFDDVVLGPLELDFRFNVASKIHQKSSFLGRLGRFWVVLGRSWGDLGGSWEGLGGILGGLGGVLAGSLGHLGHQHPTRSIF